jgi:transcriptional regulator with XRE-family HTH domain
MTVLLREAIGDRLRHARTNQHRTLREVSRAARVSLGYLSEVERGRKEASSELLAAICDALELPLPELLNNVAADMTMLSNVDSAVAEPADRRDEKVRAEDGELRARLGTGMEGGTLVPAVVEDSLSDLRIQPALTHRIGTDIAGPKVSAVFAA